MKTYQITLPDEFATFVDRVVAEGKWDTADHLVMHGLMRAMDDLRQDGETDPEALREAIRVAIAQADRGELIDGPTVVDRLRQKLQAARTPPA